MALDTTKARTDSSSVTPVDVLAAAIENVPWYRNRRAAYVRSKTVIDTHEASLADHIQYLHLFCPDAIPYGEDSESEVKTTLGRFTGIIEDLLNILESFPRENMNHVAN